LVFHVKNRHKLRANLKNQQEGCKLSNKIKVALVTLI